MANTEKKTARFNIIDLVLIIAVLACIVSVYLRYNVSENFGVNQEMEEYVLAFEIKNIRYTSAEAFPEGDPVYLAEKDVLMGTILAIDSTTPAEVIYTDTKGDYKVIYYPEDTRIDLTGRILAKGIMTEKGFLLNGNLFLAPGQLYYVETPLITVGITVNKIQPKTAAS
ncbi:MAG: DUF4330 family protein [Clostridia bacterium]|nr:DUF4330 family protein [Clostridia bacterium]